MGNLPHVDAKLLSYLERLYPDKYPDISVSERELWQASGAIQLIRHLRSIHEDQETLIKKA